MWRTRITEPSEVQSPGELRYSARLAEFGPNVPNSKTTPDRLDNVRLLHAEPLAVGASSRRGNSSQPPAASVASVAAPHYAGFVSTNSRISVSLSGPSAIARTRQFAAGRRSRVETGLLSADPNIPHATRSLAAPLSI